MSLPVKQQLRPERQPPCDIAEKPRAYAFERSLGIPPAEACRRAGGKVENGQPTKWENNNRVQAWIAYYRSLGCTEEMMAAKRARIEQRLEMAAYGNIFEFATMAEDGKDFVIDWKKVADSPYGVIISGFKFDKDTGRLTDFERDNALQAANQLRDMHGFKAPAKTEMTGPGGGAVLHGLDRDTVVRLLEQLVAVRARRIGDETKNVEGN